MSRTDEAAASVARDSRPEPDLSSAPPIAPDIAQQERMVEAMLFASAAPITAAEIEVRLPHGCDVAAALARIEARYAGRGVVLTRAGEGYALRTAPDLGFLMEREIVETRRLSRAAIETLAIIAYNQPVTRAEIEEIRGVSASRGTLDQLIEMGWIRFGRRRQSPGRPVTYVTTDDFLDHFGLPSTGDLPGLGELRASGLLASRPMPEARASDGVQAAFLDPQTGRPPDETP
ncbi:SMC-Scp complex subunit ScpB [Profundibacterium mesophilum]|uniref:Condensin subunit ScpB n=1 Tax=Profundibacterium mesophilum KAUST100406-0324 TaxID=1037889 RepID=A0A921TE99_9RHOB|nr:SMC-Scp complex subunit ScpB [Profundibacterium mesophilum]KAF0677608.1 Condensin subunit ScpB [Profundibacterium mesophilum KAUST100406-0324]